MLQITLKLLLGILLGGISFYGLVANVLVVIPVYRLAFVAKRSPIYIISLVNIFADVFNLLLTICYLVPLILKSVSALWYKESPENKFYRRIYLIVLLIIKCLSFLGPDSCSVGIWDQ